MYACIKKNNVHNNVYRQLQFTLHSVDGAVLLAVLQS